MCGRYTVVPDEHVLKRWSRYALVPNADMMRQYGPIDDWQRMLAPRYNVAPSQTVPVVTRDGLTLMTWGLVPFYRESPSTGPRMINAMAESVATKPTFRQAFTQRRLLVPASGFYEWLATAQGKVPMYFHLPERPLFAFAGLYEEREDAEGRPHRTFAIITTRPNETVGAVHSRMPVVLAEDEEDVWLDPDQEPARELKLLDPYPDGEMASHRVAQEVNSPTAEGSELIEPVPAE